MNWVILSVVVMAGETFVLVVCLRTNHRLWKLLFRARDERRQYRELVDKLNNRIEENNVQMQVLGDQLKLAYDRLKAHGLVDPPLVYRDGKAYPEYIVIHEEP